MLLNCLNIEMFPKLSINQSKSISNVFKIDNIVSKIGKILMILGTFECFQIQQHSFTEFSNMISIRVDMISFKQII